MKKVIIFGAGGFGREILAQIKDSCEVIGFLDNDEKRVDELVDGVKILGNSLAIKNYEYDEVILGTLAMSIVGQLIDTGVPREKISTDFISVRINARLNFLKDYAAGYKRDILQNYCVAEGGVLRGEFAKEINRIFPESELYLFDTFEGFDDRDIKIENEKGYSVSNVGHFAITSEKLVMSQMFYPDKVHICKGYFPESASNVPESNKYVFVNLDFDLFNPTLEGLRYFYPKMIEMGIILIHDYYHLNYKAVPEAIRAYEDELGYELVKTPIGDHCSMAIIKTVK